MDNGNRSPKRSTSLTDIQTFSHLSNLANELQSHVAVVQPDQSRRWLLADVAQLQSVSDVTGSSPVLGLVSEVVSVSFPYPDLIPYFFLAVELETNFFAVALRQTTPRGITNEYFLSSFSAKTPLPLEIMVY